MYYLERITFDRNTMAGQPCIRGMHITVALILNLVANGLTIDEIVEAYPPLEAEDVRQAVRYASRLASQAEREPASDLQQSASLPQLLHKVSSFLDELLRQEQPNKRMGASIAPLLVEILQVASQHVSDTNYEQSQLWRLVVIASMRALGRTPVGSLTSDFRSLFDKNDSTWWKTAWLRFLGKYQVREFEPDAIALLDSDDEILVGRAICYLGDISSRLGYDKIVRWIDQDPTFLRPRALYYLWRLEPKQFYSYVRKLARPVQGRICVSDDEPALREGLQDILDLEGFQYLGLGVGDGVETLERLQTAEDVILLITDIMKPRMNGLDMIRELCSDPRSYYLPIIILSAQELGVTQSYDPTQIDIVFTKPTDTDELLTAIRLLLLCDGALLEEQMRSGLAGAVFGSLY